MSEPPAVTEQRAWRRLLARIAALRGDPKLDAFLEKKHPEIAQADAGGPLGETPEAQEGAQSWFRRKLRGRGGAKEKAALCERLAETLRQLAEKHWWGADVGRVEEALAQNSSEEGPLVCAFFAKELIRTRFADMWMSREGPGVYRFGENQQRVAVQVLEGALLVHGYFEGGVLHPVRMPITSFLAQYGPKELRNAADASCDLFGNGSSGGGASVRTSARDDNRRSRSPRPTGELPPGWERRESRSKPGVFYYINDAEGLSQFERPVGAE